MVIHAKGLTGAHYGWRDWLVQRLSAVVMLGYTVLVLGIVMWHGGMEYATWKALWSNVPFRLATFAFVVSMLWHAWVGVRNIFMDYVKPAALRLTLDLLVVIVLVVYLGWTAQLLLDIAR